MSNELTDVRCPCGAEFQADSYDAGFIAGSGMRQNCDAALPPKDICTCPSGDGSLRHPCPVHPASVELAGVAAKLTFINGRPAMCGCQVEYSSGGGEYSDVIYVTLCAKHSGSAILDLVATNRIALTPEYEGQWHADLYLDREIPLAKAEGATPAEAVLALMSAERIDPEQGGVDQAGGDRWDALQSIMEWTAAENIPDDRKLCLIRNAARAALAQPSPASDLDPLNLAPHAEAFNEAPAEALKPGQAEAERPEVVAWQYRVTAGPQTGWSLWHPGKGEEFERSYTVERRPLMTVAQHDRIVGELRAVIAQLRQHKNDYMDSGQETYRALQNEIREREAEIARLDGLVSGRTAERDAALARVAELEKQERPEGPTEDELEAAGLGYPLHKEEAVKLWYSGFRSEVITVLEAWEAIGHDIGMNPDKGELLDSLRYMLEKCEAHDAALAEVAGLRSLLNSLLCYVERDIDRMRSDRDKSDNKEIYDRSISLAMERLKAAQNAVFTTEPGCDTAVELAAQTTQAQHSVPELLVRAEDFVSGKEVPQAWLDVQAERRRQITAEGWTPEHDDLYCAAELPRAAAAYILNGANDEAPAIWPFSAKWWKPRDARSNYVRAGALILAEIERLDRAAPGKEGV